MISASDLNTAFPEIDPGVQPLGPRILVQLRTVREKTDSGLILARDTRDHNKSVTQLCKIVALGAIAFCSRKDGQPWPEGVWANVGDYARIPKHGGDRFERKIPGSDGETAIFVIVNDHEIIAKVKPESFTEIDEIL